MRFHVGFSFRPAKVIPFVLAAIAGLAGLIAGGVITL